MEHITSFDPPEGNQGTASSINDGGAIAGFYHYRAGGQPPVGLIGGSQYARVREILSDAGAAFNIQL
jgi:hypothetical protein